MGLLGRQAEGLQPPPDRAAVIGVLLHNLGIELRSLDLEHKGLRTHPRQSTQTLPLGTVHHPDLDFLVTRDGGGLWGYTSSFRADDEYRWCHQMAAMVAHKYLGDEHPVSESISSVTYPPIPAARPISAASYLSRQRPLGDSHRPTTASYHQLLPHSTPPQYSHAGQPSRTLPTVASLARPPSIEYGRSSRAEIAPPLGKMSIGDGDGLGPERQLDITASMASTIPWANQPTAQVHKLGRTVLGQRVNGETVCIGWPHFTLIAL